MKKIISTLLSLALVATAFAGCASDSASSKSEDSNSKAEDSSSSAEAESSEETAEAQTLIIGGTGPLTGDYATYGISVQNGAEIAVDEINAAGGVNGMQLEIKMEDDQADPAMAVNGYAKLFDAGMKVSIGSVTSGACIAFVAEAEKDGMLSLTPSGSQLDIVEPDNSFRVCFADPGQGEFAATFIKDNAVAEKVAIIYDKSNDYSAGIQAAFAAKAKEIGLEIVATEAFTDQSNTDFSVQLQSVASSGADLLFLPIYAQEAAYVITQADKAGVDIKMFGCDGIDGILKKIGDDNLALCEELMFLTPFSADSEEQIVADFVASYKEAHNEIPDQFAADGYDAIYALKAAIEQAGITDINDEELNEKMISAMTEIEVAGTTGKMSWDVGGEPVKDAVVVTITDGAYVVYSK